MEYSAAQLVSFTCTCRIERKQMNSTRQYRLQTLTLYVLTYYNSHLFYHFSESIDIAPCSDRGRTTKWNIIWVVAFLPKVVDEHTQTDSIYYSDTSQL